MKKSHCIIARLSLIALTVLSAASCKTTEANYRAAYEATRVKQQADSALQDRTYYGTDGAESATARRRQLPGYRVYIVGTDTIDAQSMFFTMMDSTATPPQFSVAMAEFRQVFNARSMVQRLRENGFPDAYICQTSKPVYYVMSCGSDSIAHIPEMLHKAIDAIDLHVGKDYPKVIKYSGYRPK
jgi:hypothetical protein